VALISLLSKAAGSSHQTAPSSQHCDSLRKRPSATLSASARKPEQRRMSSVSLARTKKGSPARITSETAISDEPEAPVGMVPVAGVAGLSTGSPWASGSMT
jgi:hypothetical protein